MSAGVIYILSNPAFEEYVKIGYADDLPRRLAGLNASEAVPYAFRSYAVYEVDERLADTIIHRIIDTLNPELRTVEEFDGKERKREFYALSKEDAYDVLHAIAELTHTENRLHLTKPTGEEIEEERSADEVREVAERKRRKNFTFDIIGIEPGTELVCLDRPDQIAVVVDNRHVEYLGEVMTTTHAAEVATGVTYALSGPEHWTYHGKTLDQLRREIEG